MASLRTPKMTNAAWTVDRFENVALIPDHGEAINPSAIEIFEAEFESVTEVHGFEVISPSRGLPSIVFHSSPPNFQISIEVREGLVVTALKPFDTYDLTFATWPSGDQLLAEDHWYPLDLGEIGSLRNIFDDLQIELGRTITVRNYLDLIWDPRIECVVTSETEITEALKRSQGGIAFDPGLLRANLYPYQVAGSQYLVEMAKEGLGTLLADEMGLGKTMQALYLTAFISHHWGQPVLIVAPSSTMANWLRELSKFSPQLRVLLHSGSHRSGNPSYVSEWDVVLTSYDLASRDIGLFVMVDWGAVILDEAQLIKNVTAQRSQALKRIRKRVGVAVTGTPIENSLTDMWSIFEFVAPEYLGSLTDFEYAFPDEASAAVALSRLLAPLSIRRTVAQVATDLPPRVDIDTPVFAEDRLAALYETVRSDSSLSSLARLTKLRQVCAAPFSADPSWERRLTDFPKVDRLLELMETVVLGGLKALIFSSYTESIDELCFSLESRFSELFVRAIDGRKSPSQRQSDIDDFGEVNGPAALVLNPRAAGVGLNIQSASYVFHFTPEWNPATVEQASARAHRRGQDKPVFIYYLYYIGSIEEVMMDRLNAKRELQAAGTSAFQEQPSASEMARIFAMPLKTRD